jgi:hypothetical protein
MDEGATPGVDLAGGAGCRVGDTDVEVEAVIRLEVATAPSPYPACLR